MINLGVRVEVRVGMLKILSMIMGLCLRIKLNQESMSPKAIYSSVQRAKPTKFRQRKHRQKCGFKPWLIDVKII